MTDSTPLHHDLADAPPSVKLLYVLLRQDDLTPATPTRLVELTELSQETVRVALRELEDRGLVEVQPRPSDRRERLYLAKSSR